jgi:hypothetical protein
MLLPYSGLKIEVTFSYEMTISSYKTTVCDNPENYKIIRYFFILFHVFKQSMAISSP